MFEERLCSLGLRLGEPVQTQSRDSEGGGGREGWPSRDAPHGGRPGSENTEGKPRCVRVKLEGENRQSTKRGRTRLCAEPPGN